MKRKFTIGSSDDLVDGNRWIAGFALGRSTGAAQLSPRQVQMVKQAMGPLGLSFTVNPHTHILVASSEQATNRFVTDQTLLKNSLTIPLWTYRYPWYSLVGNTAVPYHALVADRKSGVCA